MKTLFTVVPMLVFMLTADAVSIDAPRKEWRGKLKSRPVKSEARRLAVTLDTAPPLTLETLTVTLESNASEAAAFEVLLSPFAFEAFDLGVTLAPHVPDVLILDVALLPQGSDASALDVVLLPHESEVEPWSIALSADFAATRRAIDTLLLRNEYPADIGTPVRIAIERGDRDEVERLTAQERAATEAAARERERHTKQSGTRKPF